MWVRGLKLNAEYISNDVLQSHPMWVRGLKLGGDGQALHLAAVAPYVGAWIETWQQATEQSRHLVAPYVGACIKLYCCSVKT